MSESHGWPITAGPAKETELKWASLSGTQLAGGPLLGGDLVTDRTLQGWRTPHICLDTTHKYLPTHSFRGCSEAPRSLFSRTRMRALLLSMVTVASPPAERDLLLGVGAMYPPQHQASRHFLLVSLALRDHLPSPMVVIMGS